jgi:hypothetical protein
VDMEYQEQGAFARLEAVACYQPGPKATHL